MKTLKTNNIDWVEVALLSSMRDNTTGLDDARLFIWLDEVREAVLLEEAETGTAYIHFRETDSCPHKSCAPITNLNPTSGPEPMELEGEDLTMAREIEEQRISLRRLAKDRKE